MKTSIIKMRKSGILIPKRELPYEVMRDGELTIMDTRENGLNRIVKLARHVWGRPGEDQSRMDLYDPHVMWVNEERMVLAGFERVEYQGHIVDYAQSWLCLIGPQKESVARFDQARAVAPRTVNVG